MRRLVCTLVSASGQAPFTAPAEGFCHLLCAEGSCVALQGGTRLDLPAGAGLFLSPGEETVLEGQGLLLAVSPGEGAAQGG